MKVTVTGATGFLGSYMVRLLVEKGFNVRGTYRNSKKAEFLKEIGVEPIYSDLGDPSTFPPVVKGSDVVIHLAAYYTFTGKKNLYQKYNVEATKLLADAALKHKVMRFIYCSSTEAIGPVDNPPADENTPPRPQFLYGWSKLEAEHEVERVGGKGLEYTIIRPSGLYGPQNVDDISYWFITSFANGGIYSKFKVGSGESLVQFTHVKDAALGFLLTIEKLEASKNQVFIIADEKAYTYNQVYSILSKISGIPEPTTSVPPTLAKALLLPLHIYSLVKKGNLLYRMDIVDAVTKHRAYSIEKAKRFLGYRPIYDLENGLRETIEWYIKHGHIEGKH